jgi:antitoxin MazE
MTLKIQKWGNSLAIRIPSALARDARLREGTTVEVSGDEQSIVMRRPEIPKYSLKELLAGVTPENIHPEVDWGPPIGKERFWENE